MAAGGGTALSCGCTGAMTGSRLGPDRLAAGLNACWWIRFYVANGAAHNEACADMARKTLVAAESRSTMRKTAQNCDA